MKFIYLLFLVLVSAPLLAESWEPLYTQHLSGEDAVVFIDRTTMRKTGKLRRVWMLTNYSKSLSIKDVKSLGFLSYRSVKTLSYFDCEKREQASSKELFFSDEMAKGTVIHTTVFATRIEKLRWNKSDVWEYVEKQISAVCKL
ncbi:MAG: surface-adhesin E family protein [Steroidobacteraceae bacterium]